MKDTAGEKVFYAINYVLLSIAALTCLLPILHIVAVSLSDSLHVASGRVSFWPKGWTLEPYRVLTQGEQHPGRVQKQCGHYRFRHRVQHGLHDFGRLSAFAQIDVRKTVFYPCHRLYDVVRRGHYSDVSRHESGRT